jgi:hypothetical protein
MPDKISERSLSLMRARVLKMSQTPYESEFDQFEDFDDLIFKQKNETMGIRVLQEFFAFTALPYSVDGKVVQRRPKKLMDVEATMRTMMKSLDQLERNKEIGCCACFQGSAENAARLAYQQLKLVEKRIGPLARVIWLGRFFVSGHVPYTDLTHHFNEWKSDTISEIFAKNSDLFAEFSCFFARENESFARIAQWITEVECSKEMRTAMMTYALINTSRSRCPSLVVVSRANLEEALLGKDFPDILARTFVKKPPASNN